MNGKPPGPIPVRQVIERLVKDRQGGVPQFKASPSRAKPYPPVIPDYGAVVTGRLAAHGAGSPPDRLGQWSYFVKILTTDGMKTFWGADLKRAVAESETGVKIESMVGVQRVGYQVVKVPLKEEKGKADGARWMQVKRARWRVEAIELFADRMRQARERREDKFRGRANAPPRAPQAAHNTMLDLARSFADRHIHHPHDRERFLEQLERKLQVGSLANRPGRDYEPPSR